SFTLVNGKAIPYITLVNADGTLDEDFVPSPEARAFFQRALSLRSWSGHIMGAAASEGIVFGTDFTSGGLTKMTDRGTLQTNYTPVIRAIGQIDRVRNDGAGNLIIAGYFDDIDGTPVRGLARLFSNGVVDRSFLPDLQDIMRVTDFALQTDGKLLVAT